MHGNTTRGRGYNRGRGGSSRGSSSYRGNSSRGASNYNSTSRGGRYNNSYNESSGGGGGGGGSSSYDNRNSSSRYQSSSSDRYSSNRNDDYKKSSGYRVTSRDRSPDRKRPRQDHSQSSRRSHDSCFTGGGGGNNSSGDYSHGRYDSNSYDKRGSNGGGGGGNGSSVSSSSHGGNSRSHQRITSPHDRTATSSRRLPSSSPGFNRRDDSSSSSHRGSSSAHHSKDTMGPPKGAPLRHSMRGGGSSSTYRGTRGGGTHNSRGGSSVYRGTRGAGSGSRSTILAPLRRNEFHSASAMSSRRRFAVVHKTRDYGGGGTSANTIQGRRLKLTATKLRSTIIKRRADLEIGTAIVRKRSTTERSDNKNGGTNKSGGGGANDDDDDDEDEDEDDDEEEEDGDEDEEMPDTGDFEEEEIMMDDDEVELEVDEDDDETQTVTVATANADQPAVESKSKPKQQHDNVKSSEATDESAVNTGNNADTPTPTKSSEKDHDTANVPKVAVDKTSTGGGGDSDVTGKKEATATTESSGSRLVSTKVHPVKKIVRKLKSKVIVADADNSADVTAALDESAGGDNSGDERPRGSAMKSSNFVPKSFIKLTCVHCYTKCLTFKEYAKHLYSRNHKLALRRIAMRQKAQLTSMRMDQRSIQRNIEQKSDNNHLRPLFCTLCRLNYRLEKSKHQMSESHRAMKKFLMPFCQVCRVPFKNPMVYETHRCSLEHIKRKARLDAANKDAGSGSGGGMESGGDDDDLDLDNFMTVDSVGKVDGNEIFMGDDADEPDTKTSEHRSDICVGSEYVKKVEVFYCELCRMYLSHKENSESGVKRHCGTTSHLRTYIHHKDDQLLRIEAERLHRQKHDTPKEVKQENIEAPKSSSSSCQIKETPTVTPTSVIKQETVSELESEDKLWADVDKDLGDLLKEVGPDANQEGDPDSTGNSERYDRFKNSDNTDECDKTTELDFEMEEKKSGYEKSNGCSEDAAKSVD